MSITDTIGNAVMAEKRRLHMAVAIRETAQNHALAGPMPAPRFSGEQIDMMLRVEVCHMIWCDLLADKQFRYLNPHSDRMSLCNVSIYHVDHQLPACGWQVINPFNPKEPLK